MPPQQRKKQSRSQKNIIAYGQPIDQQAQQPNSRGYADRKDPMPQPKEEADPSPRADVVIKFHKHAPTDTRADDIHHTLGAGPLQAAKGSHGHTGGADGVLLLEGMTLTGSKSTPSTMWPTILAALVRLGAVDNTTA